MISEKTISKIEELGWIQKSDSTHIWWVAPEDDELEFCFVENPEFGEEEWIISIAEGNAHFMGTGPIPNPMQAFELIENKQYGELL